VNELADRHVRARCGVSAPGRWRRWAGVRRLGAAAQRLPAQRVAWRTVAFFLITSAVNFAAVILVGAGVALTILPGPHTLLLSVGPLALALIAVLGTLPSHG